MNEFSVHRFVVDVCCCCVLLGWVLFLLLFAGGDVFVDGTDVVEIRMQAMHEKVDIVKWTRQQEIWQQSATWIAFAGNCEKYKSKHSGSLSLVVLTVLRVHKGQRICCWCLGPCRFDLASCQSRLWGKPALRCQWNVTQGKHVVDIVELCIKEELALFSGPLNVLLFSLPWWQVV